MTPARVAANEAALLRDKMEHDIKALIDAFYERTGLFVDQIHVTTEKVPPSFGPTASPRLLLVHVDVEVHL